MKRCLALLWVCFLSSLSALELSTIFSDHMVLQRGKPIRVWGKGKPGAQVTVSLGTNQGLTHVNPEGRWETELAAEPASFEAKTLRIQSEDQLREFQDVLIGEVWLCSGQSNMEWTLGNSENFDLYQQQAEQLPYLRLYKVERFPSETERFSAKATWTRSSRPTARHFSAVAFHFGVTLQEQLQVPVGLIQSARGASTAIAWTREAVIETQEGLKRQQFHWQRWSEEYPERLQAWQEAPEETRRPRPPVDPKLASTRPSTFARGMLAPLAPYSLRGVIWYQGESDAPFQPERYGERLEAMIADWRLWWKEPGLPFGIVQLSAFEDPNRKTSEHWPALRESQRKLVKRQAKLGLIVTIDVGERDDIHPRDKYSVGLRLARWALADVYRTLSVRGGPEVDTVEGDALGVTLSFLQTDQGLQALNGPELKGFEIAGSDGVFYPAEAKLLSKTRIRVSSGRVKAPSAVRYAWAGFPREANLVNSLHLPASPFLEPVPPLP